MQYYSILIVIYILQSTPKQRKTAVTNNIISNIHIYSERVKVKFSKTNNK